jgi:FemAB-related protein (PEP-CTERM system-associated)
MHLTLLPELRTAAVDPSSAAEWDAWVAAAPGSTACHLAGWRAVMEDALGHEVKQLVAFGPDGAWEGVLPLVRVRSRLFGHHLVSMPFLNDGGPLGTERARTALAAWAAAEAARTGADLLELRTRTPVEGPLRVSRRKVSVHLPLPATAEELWEKTFRAKLRSQIRRAQREEMEIRFGAGEAGAFYEVFARNMRDLGTPVLPRRFFEALARSLPDAAVFAAVYHQGRPVAAGCGFLHGDEFEITWASSLREANALSPNMLLYWGCMEHVIGRGARVFNFGRCTPGGGTHRFKLQWGGHDVELPWAQWSASGVASTPSPDSPKFRAAVKAWTRLPLGVANTVGPVLARLIP